MLSIESVVLPVDLVRYSEPTLRLVVHLCRAGDARLSVIGVQPGRGVAYEERYPDPAYDRIARDLQSAGRDEEPPGAPADRSEADAILEYAEGGGADLLVVTRRNLWAERMHFLTSVAEEVSCRAPCPVVAVPREVGFSPLSSSPTILAAVDLTEASARALRYASRLAEEVKARLSVLHVVEEGSASGLPLGAGTGSEPGGVGPGASEGVRRWVRGIVSGGPEQEVLVRTGPPAETIRLLASNREADLTVVARTGRSSAGDVLLGRTASRLLGQARTPVLTLPPRSRSPGRAGAPGERGRRQTPPGRPEPGRPRRPPPVRP